MNAAAHAFSQPQPLEAPSVGPLAASRPDELIRLVGHELDNSLAPILSLARSAGTLLERPDGRERLALVLDTIAERAERLHRFASACLRLGAVPPPLPAPTRWRPLLCGLARLHGVRFQVAPDDLVTWMDAAQIEQTLVNLVKNAREAGSAAEEIEIVVRAGGDGTEVLVRDRGPGLSPERLAAAARRLTSSKPGGGGIGLALARNIVEAHGGAIGLANRPAGGLEVRIWLPAH